MVTERTLLSEDDLSLDLAGGPSEAGPLHQGANAVEEPEATNGTHQDLFGTKMYTLMGE